MPIVFLHGGMSSTQWLSLQIDSLRRLDRVNHNDADSRLSALIRKFQKEIARLVELETLAWRKEMIAVGLMKMSSSGVLRPVTIPGGE